MPVRKPRLGREPTLKLGAARKTSRASKAVEAEAQTEQAEPPPKVASPPPPPTTKADQVVALLSRPEGATLAQMVELTGWKTRSMRGFMSGQLKGRRKLEVTSSKAEGVRTYRIEAR